MGPVGATSVFLDNLKTIEPLTDRSMLREAEDNDMFGAIFKSAVNNLNRTNGYLSKAEDEEIKLAIGESTSTHDLAVALQKASTSPARCCGARPGERPCRRPRWRQVRR